jgi:hypothetical protein
MPSTCAFTQRTGCTTGFGAPVLPPLNLMICASSSAAVDHARQTAAPFLDEPAERPACRAALRPSSRE